MPKLLSVNDEFRQQLLLSLVDSAHNFYAILSEYDSVDDGANISLYGLKGFHIPKTPLVAVKIDGVKFAINRKYEYIDDSVLAPYSESTNCYLINPEDIGDFLDKRINSLYLYQVFTPGAVSDVKIITIVADLKEDTGGGIYDCATTAVVSSFAAESFDDIKIIGHSILENAISYGASDSGNISMLIDF